MTSSNRLKSVISMMVIGLIAFTGCTSEETKALKVCQNTIGNQAIVYKQICTSESKKWDYVCAIPPKSYGWVIKDFKYFPVSNTGNFDYDLYHNPCELNLTFGN